MKTIILIALISASQFVFAQAAPAAAPAQPEVSILETIIAGPDNKDLPVLRTIINGPSAQRLYGFLRSKVVQTSSPAENSIQNQKFGKRIACFETYNDSTEQTSYSCLIDVSAKGAE